MRKCKYLMLLVVFFVAIGVGYSLRDFSIIISRSESLPYSYFVGFGGKEFQKNDYVLIVDHSTRYFPEDTIFVKKLIGLPGDKISYASDGIYVSGSLVGELLEKTSENQDLTPINIEYIPQDYVFVAGEHPRSFDSRYKEFGLVPLDKISRRVLALW